MPSAFRLLSYNFCHPERSDRRERSRRIPSAGAPILRWGSFANPGRSCPIGARWKRLSNALRSIHLSSTSLVGGGVLDAPCRTCKFPESTELPLVGTGLPDGPCRTETKCLLTSIFLFVLINIDISEESVRYIRWNRASQGINRPDVT